MKSAYILLCFVCISFLGNFKVVAVEELALKLYSEIFTTELQRVVQSPRTLQEIHLQESTNVHGIMIGCANYTSGDNLGKKCPQNI